MCKAWFLPKKKPGLRQLFILHGTDREGFQVSPELGVLCGSSHRNEGKGMRMDPCSRLMSEAGKVLSFPLEDALIYLHKFIYIKSGFFHPSIGFFTGFVDS